MLNSVGMFALGLLLLLLGGDSVLRGASGLAQRLGLSPFATGLLLVAFATSLPELAVNLTAVAAGQPALALGNAVGSNIVNIGMTLGLAALVAPLTISMRLLATEVLVIVGASVVLLVFGLDGVIARWEGALLVAAFVAFLAYGLSRGRRETSAVQQELAAFSVTSTNLLQNLLRLAFAMALLYFGSRLVVGHAPMIGAALGMDSMLTGLIIVAIGTALPEVVTAALAARNGQGNVVAGHVLGACIFNLLFIIGGMAAWRPLALPASMVRLELPAAIALALVLIPIVRGDLRIGRGEGAIMLLGFAGWLGFELLQVLA